VPASRNAMPLPNVLQGALISTSDTLLIVVIIGVTIAIIVGLFITMQRRTTEMSDRLYDEYKSKFQIRTASSEVAPPERPESAHPLETTQLAPERATLLETPKPLEEKPVSLMLQRALAKIDKPKPVEQKQPAIQSSTGATEQKPVSLMLQRALAKYAEPKPVEERQPIIEPQTETTQEKAKSPWLQRGLAKLEKVLEGNLHPMDVTQDKAVSLMPQQALATQNEPETTRVAEKPAPAPEPVGPAATEETKPVEEEASSTLQRTLTKFEKTKAEAIAMSAQDVQNLNPELEVTKEQAKRYVREFEELRAKERLELHEIETLRDQMQRLRQEIATQQHDHEAVIRYLQQENFRLQKELQEAARPEKRAKDRRKHEDQAESQRPAAESKVPEILLEFEERARLRQLLEETEKQVRQLQRARERIEKELQYLQT
jgi:hypothetical protein